MQGCFLPNLAPIRNPIWPPGRHLGFSYEHYISRTICAINLKFLSCIGIHARMCPAKFRADRKSNMAARAPSWIFFRTLYLKNHLSNHFEIFIIYWYPCRDVSCQILRRSEIQYGRQGAILDFLLDTISQEPFEQSI